MLLSFLFLHENICCGYSLEAPRRGASNEYPQHTFLWRNKKNIMWITPLICSYAYVVTTWAITKENVPSKVHPTKTQISLGIRTIWSVFLSTWKNFTSLAIQNVHNEDSDQTKQIGRLVQIFPGTHVWRYTFWLCSSHNADTHLHIQNLCDGQHQQKWNHK